MESKHERSQCHVVKSEKKVRYIISRQCPVPSFSRGRSVLAACVQSATNLDVILRYSRSCKERQATSKSVSEKSGEDEWLIEISQLPIPRIQLILS